MHLVDSHCHLDMLDITADGGNIQPTLTRAQEQGVIHLLNVCVKMSDFPAVLRMAEQHPQVSASVGLHPNEQAEEVDTETLIKLGNHPKVVAVGETGLDYFRSTGDLTWQQDRFRVHIRAAKALGIPIIVHTRQAKEDTMRILREEGANEVGGVMHCFTEDWEMAQQALDLNFYISFSGVVTFKNAAVIQDSAKYVPLNCMLLETDAPYLAPEPRRGHPNQPAYVRHTAKFIATLRNIEVNQLAEQTTKNFFTLFKKANQAHV